MSTQKWIEKMQNRKRVKVARRKITLRYLINEINKDLQELGEPIIDLEKYRKKYKCIERMIKNEQKNTKRRIE